MRLDEICMTIVGLGLMGGSFALALKSRMAKLVGVDINPATVELAQRLGIVDDATDNLAVGLDECDLAILAVPVQTILNILARMGRDLPAPRFVLDLGSTKVEIVRRMHTLPSSVDPLGGHPLCGKETSGLKASNSNLFQDQTFVLTPLERTSSNMTQLAHKLIDALGARPLVMDAKRHDHLIAITSHLPYLLASTLFSVALETGVADEVLWNMVASGFKDTTRLAGSDVTMMTDILLTNREEVLNVLKRSQTTLQDMEEYLSSEDDKGLFTELTRIQSQRSRLISSHPTNENNDGIMYNGSSK